MPAPPFIYLLSGRRGICATQPLLARRSTTPARLGIPGAASAPIPSRGRQTGTNGLWSRKPIAGSQPSSSVTALAMGDGLLPLV
jgi:hypothetical protein